MSFLPGYESRAPGRGRRAMHQSVCAMTGFRFVESWSPANGRESLNGSAGTSCRGPVHGGFSVMRFSPRQSREAARRSSRTRLMLNGVAAAAIRRERWAARHRSPGQAILQPRKHLERFECAVDGTRVPWRPQRAPRYVQRRNNYGHITSSFHRNTYLDVSLSAVTCSAAARRRRGPITSRRYKPRVHIYGTKNQLVARRHVEP